MTGNAAALAIKIDAQTSPKLLADLIAPSPKCRLLLGVTLSWLRLCDKRPQRMGVRNLSGVSLMHQVAMQQTARAVFQPRLRLIARSVVSLPCNNAPAIGRRADKPSARPIYGFTSGCSAAPATTRRTRSPPRPPA